MKGSLQHSKIDKLRQRLLREPNDGKTLHELGQAYAARNELGLATTFLCQAVASEPKIPEHYVSFGDVLLRGGRNLEAVCAFRQALSLDRNHANAYGGLGLALHAIGEITLATGALSKAIERLPQNQTFWVNLSEVLRDKGEYLKAYEAAVKALTLHNNSKDNTNVTKDVARALAESLFGLGKIDKALKWLHKAIDSDPMWDYGHNNIGRGLAALDRYKEAKRYYDKAISLNPGNVDAHIGRAKILLASGNFVEGWKEYEWRFKLSVALKSMTVKFINRLTEPMWSGEKLEGKTLLVYGEQGFGDTMQSVRYVAELASHRCRIILMVYRELVRLFNTIQGVTSVVSYGDLIPRYDYHIPMFSLPNRLKFIGNAIPNNIPYIRVPDHCKIPPAISKTSRLRVGFIWHTKRLGVLDYRSVPLRFLEPLFRHRSVQFYSFQLADGAKELDRYARRSNVQNLKPFIKDWAQTAVFLNEMDLLISIDSGIAHLAGALGLPVWVMLSPGADWRWGMADPGRQGVSVEKTLWYPTMRLYRAPSVGLWGPVVRRMEEDLEKVVSRRF